jgi:hypothetical protein
MRRRMRRMRMMMMMRRRRRNGYLEIAVRGSLQQQLSVDPSCLLWWVRVACRASDLW